MGPVVIEKRLLGVRVTAVDTLGQLSLSRLAEMVDDLERRYRERI